MPSHILMIVDSAPPLYGGAGAQAALLASRLRARGYRVDILSRQKQRVQAPAMSTTYVRPYIANRKLSSLVFQLAVLWRVLTTRADVIHCHGGYGYSFAAVMAARLRSKPSIVKVTLLGSDDPATVAAKRLGILRYGRVQATLFTRASRVVAVTEQIEEAIIAAAPTAAVSVIPNGVELGPSPVDAHSATAPRVAYLGALVQRKGIDTLMQAWPQFRTCHPDATLTLIGPQSEEMAHLFEDAEALADLGVTCTGLLPTARARQVLASASLYVLPSREEGQPNSLIEAMATGLACCASNISPNVLTAGEAAVFFPVGDPVSLAAALEQTWRNRESLAAAGLRRAAVFDINAVVQRYVELYPKLEASPHWVRGRSNPL